VTRTAPFGFARVVFLSHVVRAGDPVFPGDPPVRISPAAAIEADGYHVQSLVTGEQAGTHWAAPAHFHAGLAAADDLDAGDFFFPAVVLDVRAEAKEDADFALGVPDVRKDPGRLRLARHRIRADPVEDRGELPPGFRKLRSTITGGAARGRAEGRALGVKLSLNVLCQVLSGKKCRSMTIHNLHVKDYAKY
jgi:hypothetical protein